MFCKFPQTGAGFCKQMSVWGQIGRKQAFAHCYWSGERGTSVVTLSVSLKYLSCQWLTARELEVKSE